MCQKKTRGYSSQNAANRNRNLGLEISIENNKIVVGWGYNGWNFAFCNPDEYTIRVTVEQRRNDVFQDRIEPNPPNMLPLGFRSRGHYVEPGFNKSRGKAPKREKIQQTRGEHAPGAAGGVAHFLAWQPARTGNSARHRRLSHPTVAEQSWEWGYFLIYFFLLIPTILNILLIILFFYWLGYPPRETK